jgi:gliding motility-associated-like protein
LNIRPRKVYSPNSSFEPTWIIENTENYPDCTLSIFDGRGMRIFEQKGYNNEWNGTFNGKALPGGSYFFVFGSEETGVVKGSVLLVR